MNYIILGSGSKGNSTIIGSRDSFLIIDAGIGIREFKNKLRKHGYEFKDINAVLITHNHSDHTKAIKYLPVEVIYGDSAIEEVEVNNQLKPFEKRVINGFEITPLPLSHDSENCFGFVIEKNGEKLIYVTDTGYINYKLKPYLDNGDYYIMESNYDVKMLINSSRPGHLKNRILSDNGHLSNDMASEYLCELIGDKTKEIIFAHISEEVNTNEKVIKTFKEVANLNNVKIDNIKLKVADQKIETCGGRDYEETHITN